MRYRRLGRTEMMVSEVGFGTSPLGGMWWGEVEDDVSVAAIRRSFDLGVNFFDTADLYGHGRSEELIARALAGKRPNVVIATKVGIDFRLPHRTSSNFVPAYVRQALEASLSRLKTDYVDLYQLHNPPQELAKDERIWSLLTDLKAEGKIRFFGISARTVNDAVRYLKLADAEDEHSQRYGDTVQVAYNMLDQEAATRGVFVDAARQDWGVITRVPLASGMLAGKYAGDHDFPPGDFRGDWSHARLSETVRRVESLRAVSGPLKGTMAQTAIAFALSQETASTVISGAKDSGQAEENAAASEFAPLGQNDLRAAQQLYENDFVG